MRKLSPNDSYNWFPVLELENWETLDWEPVFFSEVHSEEGEMYNCEEEDFKLNPFALPGYTGWHEVVMDYYYDEIIDGEYRYEYRFDVDVSRIVIRVKNIKGKVVDTLYFWCVPKNDESEWIWKD